MHNELLQYLPPRSIEKVCSLLSAHAVHLRITRSRQSKLGDYRPPVKDTGHRISVNKDLNPYLFLIILIHEIAHAVVYDRFGNRVKPHGMEWKKIFKDLMHLFVEDGIFPDDVETAVEHYLQKTYASVTSDSKLMKMLSQYDEPDNSAAIFIDELPHDALFSVSGSRIFRKGEKIRKRYKCYCLSNKRYYLFSPVSRIIPLD